MAPVLVKHAAMAYCGEDVVAAQLCADDWDFERYIDSGLCQCYVAVDKVQGSDAVVAFAGTHNLRDVLTDMQANLVPWVNGKKVHGGFKTAVDSVWGTLWPILSELVGHGVDLHFTGHSKGGAEANYATAKVLFNHKPVKSLVTFGCPRVGDKWFANYLDEHPVNHLRFVCNNDIVARAPFRGWLAKYLPFGWLFPVGYRHAGTLQYITAKGEILTNPPRDVLAWDRINGRWLAGRKWWRDGTADHGISNYVEALA